MDDQAPAADLMRNASHRAMGLHVGSAFALTFVLWAAVVTTLVVTFAIVAWDDRDDAAPRAVALATVVIAPTPRPRPAGVPPTAGAVAAPLTLGERQLLPGATPGSLPLFYALTCRDDVMAITTTRFTVYAELPCQGSIPQSRIDRYAGQPLRITVNENVLTIDTAAVGAASFAVGRVWLEQR